MVAVDVKHRKRNEEKQDAACILFVLNPHGRKDECMWNEATGEDEGLMGHSAVEIVTLMHCLIPLEPSCIVWCLQNSQALSDVFRSHRHCLMSSRTLMHCLMSSECSCIVWCLQNSHALFELFTVLMQSQQMWTLSKRHRLPSSSWLTELLLLALLQDRWLA